MYRIGRATRVSCMVVLLALPCPSAKGAECAVKEFFTDSITSSAPQVVPPVISVEIKALNSRAAAASVAQRPLEFDDEEQRQRRLLWDAINRRDLVAFRKLIPPARAAAQAMLRKSYALDSAFAASALPIVKTILALDPSALNDRTAAMNASALQGAARNWQWVETRARDGIPMENPPPTGDHIELMRLLLDAGADANGQILDWRTPLAILGAMEPSPATEAAAELLLQHGATIEKYAANGRSALAMAAEKANGGLVRLMLRYRQPSQDALDQAVIATPIVQSNEVLPLLLERGANLNADVARAGDGKSWFLPAWQAGARMKFHNERALMQLMIRYKANPNGVLNKTDSPLMSVMHDLELMQGLLDLGANPNYVNYEGDTPLHKAIRLPREVRKAPGDDRPLKVIAPALDPEVRARSVALLLRYGANPNAPTASGATPLALTRDEDAEMIDLLDARGAVVTFDPSTLQIYRAFPVSMGSVSVALAQRNDSLAAVILKHQPRIAADDCGAVYYAARSGATKTLAALLDKGGDPNGIADGLGMSPFLAAAHKGQLESVKILLTFRAVKINETVPRRIGSVGGHGWAVNVTLGGQTALMLAAAAKHRDVVELLLRSGADVNRTDVNGFGLVEYARAGGAEDIVAMVLARGARERRAAPGAP